MRVLRAGATTVAAMSPAAPAHLLVVRHGQSTWNAEGRWQGTEDPPLSTLGVRQARHAARYLGTFDAIVASTLQRAATTASIIAEELGLGPVRTDPDLRERHAGALQGLTGAEIAERFPDHPENRAGTPGWEPDEEVVERAVAALARVAVEVGPGGTALVVSHGGVITQLELLTGAHRAHRLANLGGRWFTVGRGGIEAGEAVVLVDPDELTAPRQL